MRHHDYCEAFEREAALVAALLDGADWLARVPGCPEWNLEDLVAHLGLVHRRTAYLVSHRSTTRVATREMNLTLGPVTLEWFLEGAAHCLDALRRADPDDEMWAWGADQHVRFWSRRMVHETLVHRFDVEQALHLDSDAAASLCADALDEYLLDMHAAARFSKKLAALQGSGTVSFVCTDAEGAWTLTLHDNGFVAARDSGATWGDATVSGPAKELLLAAYRRSALDELADVAVEGSASLIDHVFEHLGLE